MQPRLPFTYVAELSPEDKALDELIRPPQEVEELSLALIPLKFPLQDKRAKALRNSPPQAQPKTKGAKKSHHLSTKATPESYKLREAQLF